VQVPEARGQLTFARSARPTGLGQSEQRTWPKNMNSTFSLQVFPAPGTTDTQKKDVRRMFRRVIVCSKTHVVYRTQDTSVRYSARVPGDRHLVKDLNTYVKPTMVLRSGLTRCDESGARPRRFHRKKGRQQASLQGCRQRQESSRRAS